MRRAQLQRVVAIGGRGAGLGSKIGARRIELVRRAEYGTSRFVEDAESNRSRGGPRAGARAPNAALARHADVFDLIGGYRFTVLALSRKALDRDETRRLSAQLGTLGSSVDGIAAHLVTRVPVGRDPHAIFVDSADVFDAYGLDGADAQAIYVLRPDGYVCWRGEGLDVAACQRFLARFGHGDRLHG